MIYTLAGTRSSKRRADEVSEDGGGGGGGGDHARQRPNTVPEPPPFPKFLIKTAPYTGQEEDLNRPGIARSALQPVLTASLVQEFVTESGKSSDGGVLFLLDPPGNILKPAGSGQQNILPRDIWTETEIDLLAETVTQCCKPLNNFSKSVVICWCPWQLMGAYKVAFEEHGWKTQAPIYAVNSDPHTSVRRASQSPSTHTYMMFTRIGSGFFSSADAMATALPQFAKTRYHDHFQVGFALGTEKVLVDTSASKEMLRPEQKSVDEMRRFVAQFCPEDGIVVTRGAILSSI
jgi:hypothetical protein